MGRGPERGVGIGNHKGSEWRWEAAQSGFAMYRKALDVVLYLEQEILGGQFLLVGQETAPHEADLPCLKIGPPEMTSSKGERALGLIISH